MNSIKLLYQLVLLLMINFLIISSAFSLWDPTKPKHIKENNEKIAMIKIKGNKPTAYLSDGTVLYEGDYYNGMKVVKISESMIKLENNQNTFKLMKLFK